MPLGACIAGGEETKLVKPKTARGRRVLEGRGPKAVEDEKNVLLMHGNNTSQIVKDVLADVHRLKAQHSIRYSRKNENIRPFEPGGESSLEFYSKKTNCSLFAVGSHSKKRPHNLVLGRMFDFRLYDAIEFGVESFKCIKEFGSAGTCQVGNKPCMVFVGDKFESVPQQKVAKSMLLDFFRGEEVPSINLAGLDRLMVFVAIGDSQLLMYQYKIALKASGGRVPRVALCEMGPRLCLTVRRFREAPPDLATEALKKPKLDKKKEKNVSSNLLDGKVGRIYMPKQNVDKMAITKPYALKRRLDTDGGDNFAKKNRKTETKAN